MRLLLLVLTLFFTAHRILGFRLFDYREEQQQQSDVPEDPVYSAEDTGGGGGWGQSYHHRISRGPPGSDAEADSSVNQNGQSASQRAAISSSEVATQAGSSTEATHSNSGDTHAKKASLASSRASTRQLTTSTKATTTVRAATTKAITEVASTVLTSERATVTTTIAQTAGGTTAQTTSTSGSTIAATAAAAYATTTAAVGTTSSTVAVTTSTSASSRATTAATTRVHRSTVENHYQQGPMFWCYQLSADNPTLVQRLALWIELDSTNTFWEIRWGYFQQSDGEVQNVSVMARLLKGYPTEAEAQRRIHALFRRRVLLHCSSSFGTVTPAQVMDTTHGFYAYTKCLRDAYISPSTTSHYNPVLLSLWIDDDDNEWRIHLQEQFLESDNHTNFRLAVLSKGAVAQDSYYYAQLTLLNYIELWCGPTILRGVIDGVSTARRSPIIHCINPSVSSDLPCRYICRKEDLLPGQMGASFASGNWRYNENYANLWIYTKDRFLPEDIKLESYIPSINEQPYLWQYDMHNSLVENLQLFCSQQTQLPMVCLGSCFKQHIFNVNATGDRASTPSWQQTDRTMLIKLSSR